MPTEQCLAAQPSSGSNLQSLRGRRPRSSASLLLAHTHDGHFSTLDGVDVALGTLVRPGGRSHPCSSMHTTVPTLQAALQAHAAPARVHAYATSLPCMLLPKSILCLLARGRFYEQVQLISTMAMAVCQQRLLASLTFGAGALDFNPARNGGVSTEAPRVTYLWSVCP